MTNEEALDVLMNKIQIDVRCTDDFQRDKKCLFKCKDALEKQIPKKVIHKVDHIEAWYCPVCKAWQNDTGYFCDRCGQALDWSEE